ncbi:MAG TPA: DUF4097 family beta strand repeat-containing protein, partial [Gammaproteobacteria bacterium]|nr:DUF4097 family beta strand repeat-containing protein [Gammaproteobacteria bacterium]
SVNRPKYLLCADAPTQVPFNEEAIMNPNSSTHDVNTRSLVKAKSSRMCFLALLLSAPLATLADVSEVEEFDFDIDSGGELSVSNINGDITVTGGSGKVVRIVAIKKADDQGYLDGIKIRVSANPDRVTIKTEHPKSTSRWFGGGGNGSVTYEITVPSDIHLDSIDTVNGDIDVSGVRGDVNADTTNGDITLADLAGSVEVDTVNGGIDATFVTLGGNQKVLAETVNGRVQLRLPSDCSAEVDAGTVNGGIDADDFGLDAEKAFLGRDLEGSIGKGEARVKVRTVNGSIKIRRA